MTVHVFCVRRIMPFGSCLILKSNPPPTNTGMMCHQLEVSLNEATCPLNLGLHPVPGATFPGDNPDVSVIHTKYHVEGKGKQVSFARWAPSGKVHRCLHVLVTERSTTACSRRRFLRHSCGVRAGTPTPEKRPQGSIERHSLTTPGTLKKVAGKACQPFRPRQGQAARAAIFTGPEAVPRGSSRDIRDSCLRDGPYRTFSDQRVTSPFSALMK